MTARRVIPIVYRPSRDEIVTDSLIVATFTASMERLFHWLALNTFHWPNALIALAIGAAVAYHMCKLRRKTFWRGVGSQGESANIQALKTRIATLERRLANKPVRVLNTGERFTAAIREAEHEDNQPRHNVITIPPFIGERLDDLANAIVEHESISVRVIRSGGFTQDEAKEVTAWLALENFAECKPYGSKGRVRYELTEAGLAWFETIVNDSPTDETEND